MVQPYAPPWTASILRFRQKPNRWESSHPCVAGIKGVTQEQVVVVVHVSVALSLSTFMTTVVDQDLATSSPTAAR